MPVGTGVRQCPSSKFWDLMAYFENILSTRFKVGEGIRRWLNGSKVRVADLYAKRSESPVSALNVDMCMAQHL
jgi:hypothetical protein